MSCLAPDKVQQLTLKEHHQFTTYSSPQFRGNFDMECEDTFTAGLGYL